MVPTVLNLTVASQVCRRACAAWCFPWQAPAVASRRWAQLSMTQPPPMPSAASDRQLWVAVLPSPLATAPICCHRRHRRSCPPPPVCRSNGQRRRVNPPLRESSRMCKPPTSPTACRALLWPLWRRSRRLVAARGAAAVVVGEPMAGHYHVLQTLHHCRYQCRSRFRHHRQCSLKQR